MANERLTLRFVPENEPPFEVEATENNLWTVGALASVTACPVSGDAAVRAKMDAAMAAVACEHAGILEGLRKQTDVTGGVTSLVIAAVETAKMAHGGVEYLDELVSLLLDDEEVSLAKVVGLAAKMRSKGAN